MKFTVTSLITILLFCSFLSSTAHSKDREWVKKFAKLNLVEKEVNEKRFALNSLLKASEAEKDNEAKKEYFAKAVKKHAEYKEKVAEYNRLRQELKYKHPDQGDESIRKYLPLRQQSIQEIQKESGFNSQLSALQKQVKEKYYKYIADEEEARQVDYSKPTGEKFEQEQITLEK